jgi:hypothetical protein
MLRYWVFHSEQLDQALARNEAERIKAGASEQQAKDDTAVIKTFLTVGPGTDLLGGLSGKR